MRKKDKPIIPGCEISDKILSLLKKKQGDDTLYSIAKEIGVQQGTLRRKLENPNGWSEVKIINNLLKFFGENYEYVFNNSSEKFTMTDLIKIHRKQKEELEYLTKKNESLLKKIESVRGIDVIKFAESQLSDSRK